MTMAIKKKRNFMKFKTHFMGEKRIIRRVAEGKSFELVSFIYKVRRWLLT